MPFLIIHQRFTHANNLVLNQDDLKTKIMYQLCSHLSEA